MLGTLTPKHVHLLPAVFFQFHLEERLGMDMCKLSVISQERLKMEVDLLLSPMIWSFTKFIADTPYITTLQIINF